jgi:hypothetical protein
MHDVTLICVYYCREEWEKLLRIVRCEIISKTSDDDMDAYVLRWGPSRSWHFNSDYRILHLSGQNLYACKLYKSSIWILYLFSDLVNIRSKDKEMGKCCKPFNSMSKHSIIVDLQTWNSSTVLELWVANFVNGENISNVEIKCQKWRKNE